MHHLKQAELCEYASERHHDDENTDLPRLFGILDVGGFSAVEICEKETTSSPALKSQSMTSLI
jgi:hypothetical protein